MNAAQKWKLFRIQMQYLGISTKLRNRDYRSGAEMNETQVGTNRSLYLFHLTTVSQRMDVYD